MEIWVYQKETLKNCRTIKKFGAKIKLTKKDYLTIEGNKNLLPIKYLENKGSAQCKSSVIFAGLKLRAKHLLKQKNQEIIPNFVQTFEFTIKIKKLKNYDLIEWVKQKRLKL